MNDALYQQVHKDSYLDFLLEVGRSFSLGSNPSSFDAAMAYKTDAFAGKIIDLPVEAVRKAGILWECTEAEPALIQEVQEAIDTSMDTFLEAVTLARIYGGSLLLIGASDGEPTWTRPLSEESVASIDFLTPLSSREAAPSSVDSNALSPTYGLPREYLVGKERIHHSRVLRFDGLSLPRQVLGGGWGEGVLARPLTYLLDFVRCHQQVFQTIKDFNQRVLKLDGLAEKVATPGGRQRTEEMIRSKAKALSAMGIMALDAEKEDYFVVARNYQGINELLQQSAQILAAAVDFPPSKLLALFHSPGLAAEDTTQARAWADFIASFQRRMLYGQMTRYIHLILCAKLGKDAVPKNGRLIFGSTIEMSKKEEQALKAEEAKRIDILLKYQVVTPQEVAESLARDIPVESVIDLSARKNTWTQYPEGYG